MVNTRGISRAALVLLAAVAALSAGTAIVLAATTGQPHRQPVIGSGASIRPLSINCPSGAVGGKLPAQVYLSPGYSASGARYPVVYFLHGLPATAQSYTQNAFVARALLAAHERAIVAAPQAARADGDDREYLDWSPTENWPAAVSRDLTRCIDRRFHTMTKRSGRALIGLSAGGYGAFNVGLRHLQTFGAVESWSGYFVATDPSGRHVLKLASPQAQRSASVPTGAALAAELRRWPALIAFYVGQADDRFLDMNQAFDATLRSQHLAHVFRSYAGGHSQTLWQAEASVWLSMALRFLANGHLPDGGSSR